MPRCRRAPLARSPAIPPRLRSSRARRRPPRRPRYPTCARRRRGDQLARDRVQLRGALPNLHQGARPGARRNPPGWVPQPGGDHTTGIVVGLAHPGGTGGNDHARIQRTRSADPPGPGRIGASDGNLLRTLLHRVADRVTVSHGDGQPYWRDGGSAFAPSPATSSGARIPARPRQGDRAGPRVNQGPQDAAPVTIG